MLMWTCTLSWGQDFRPLLPEVSYSGEELIPRLGGAYPGRRARHDEIARFERVVLRQERDLLGHAPDHLVDIRVLAKLAVYLEPELAFFRVTALRGGSDRPDRGGLVEILAKGPGLALVLADLLQIAPGHVQAHRVTPDVLVGLGRRDLAAARADYRNHLGLPVVIARHRRIVHGAALGDQIVSRFGEEERLLAAVPAHLLLVLHVVAADTEDAAHGKARVRSRDGKRGDVPAADDVLHFHVEVLAKKARIFSQTASGGRVAGDLASSQKKRAPEGARSKTSPSPGLSLHYV